MRMIGRVGKPVDPASHLGCKGQEGGERSWRWACRTGGEANDARACMDRDKDSPGAMARSQPPGKPTKPWRGGPGGEGATEGERLAPRS